MTTPLNPKTCLSLLTGSLLASALAWNASAQAVSVDAAMIRATVEKHVRQQMQALQPGAARETLSVEIPQVPGAPFNLPTVQSLKDVQLEASSTLGDTYANRAVVRVKISTAEGRQRELGVPVHLIIKKPVWVVKNPIGAHEPLSPRNLALENREISNTYSYAVGQERNPTEYLARVNLRPGEILDSRKMHLPPDVRRNNDVRIVLSNGQNMNITVSGIALSDGRIGETIRVRQDTYKRRTFTAKVIDKNRVLVEM